MQCTGGSCVHNNGVPSFWAKKEDGEDGDVCAVRANGSVEKDCALDRTTVAIIPKIIL